MTNTQLNHQIDCITAEALIDELRLSSEERHFLEEHIAGCVACQAKYDLEFDLREVLIPGRLPSPSPGFETELMARLDLSPISAEITEPSILRSYWLWLGIVAVSAISIITIGSDIEYFVRILTLLWSGALKVLLNINQIALPISLSLPAIDSIFPGVNPALLINAILAGITLFTGAFFVLRTYRD